METDLKILLGEIKRKRDNHTGESNKRLGNKDEAHQYHLGKALAYNDIAKRIQQILERTENE